jgi:hypothetical protein
MSDTKASSLRTAQINTYAEIWSAATYFLEEGRTTQEGCYFHFMASLVFTAFALEAYLNHVGERLFRSWPALERLSPSEKLDVIAEKLGVSIEYGTRPFQTVSQLFRFRNSLAHGKSLSLRSEDPVSINTSTAEGRFASLLQAWWQENCTLESAERAQEDVENIITLFHAKAGMNDDLLFCPGSWSGPSESSRDEHKP